MKLSALAVATALFSGPIFAAPLTLQTCNPQEEGIFVVNSTLVSGPHEAVLFDAQFSVEGGEKLVDMIEKSSKSFMRIVIASGNPDFYFSLESPMKTSPQAEVIATSEVVKHIEVTKVAKLAHWSPQMKDGASIQVYTPQALKANSLTIDSEKITIMQPHNHVVFVWTRANKTIPDDTGVAWGIRLWTADTQTLVNRQQWRRTLGQTVALYPQWVISGHYLGTPPKGDNAVCFIRMYLQQFEQALKAHQDSAEAIKATETQWPGLAETSLLESSTKVNTGEMRW